MSTCIRPFSHFLPDLLKQWAISALPGVLWIALPKGKSFGWDKWRAANTGDCHSGIGRLTSRGGPVIDARVL